MASKISKFDDGIVAVGSDDLIIARGGNNFRISATQYNALSLLAQNNLLDLDDATTALANLGGISLDPPRAMQLYSASDVQVVDPGGNGDYTTVREAIANRATGDVTWVFGHTTETDTIALNGSGDSGTALIYLTPGSSMTLNAAVTQFFNVNSTGQLLIWGTGSIRNDVAGTTIRLQDTARLRAEDFRIVNAAVSGIVVASTTCSIQLFRVKINRGGGNSGIWFDGPITGTGDKNIFKDCLFRAWGASGVGANSNAAWANAPFYHCTFASPDNPGNARSNITFAAGNNTNVDIP